MANDNVLSEEDILLIKESLLRSLITADKMSNEMQYPAIVRSAMKEASVKYRTVLEKINMEVPNRQGMRRIK